MCPTPLSGIYSFTPTLKGEPLSVKRTGPLDLQKLTTTCNRVLLHAPSGLLKNPPQVLAGAVPLRILCCNYLQCNILNTRQHSYCVHFTRQLNFFNTPFTEVTRFYTTTTIAMNKLIIQYRTNIPDLKHFLSLDHRLQGDTCRVLSLKDQGSGLLSLFHRIR